MRRDWKETLKSLLYIFSCVTTGIVVGSIVYVALFEDFESSEYAKSLLSIVCMAFATTLPALIYPNREVKRSTALILKVTHYLIICAIVFFLGRGFSWFAKEDYGAVIGTWLLTTVIFVGVHLAVYFRSKRLADAMNECLKRFDEVDNE